MTIESTLNSNKLIAAAIGEELVLLEAVAAIDDMDTKKVFSDLIAVITSGVFPLDADKTATVMLSANTELTNLVTVLGERLRVKGIITELPANPFGIIINYLNPELIKLIISLSK